jgi:hypothetical protein
LVPYLIINSTNDMDGSGGNGGDGSDDGIAEGKSAQDNHIAYIAQDNHAALVAQAVDLAVELPIVEFHEQIVDSCESPFL